MNTIIVTDPSGMRYYFGAEYEGCYDRDDIFMRTAWALYKIGIFRKYPTNCLPES